MKELLVNESLLNESDTKKQLPDIIIQYEHVEPLGIEAIADIVSGELKSFVDKDIQTDGPENSIRFVISRYLVDTIYTVTSEKIKKMSEDNKNMDNFLKYYVEDNATGSYRLKQDFKNDPKKELFDTHLEYGLEPVRIKIKDENGEIKYYYYLFIDFDSLKDEINAESITEFCRQINNNINSQNIIAAPNIPCGIGEPNSFGGPAKEPVELDKDLIEKLKGKKIEELREIIGFHSFINELEHQYLVPGDKKSDVDIYILDTFPYALEEYNDSNNKLMLRLKNEENMKLYKNELVKSNFKDPVKNNNNDFKRIKMPDHGLFIAGIINMLSSESKIHLIEVLDCDVEGDLRALIWGIAKTISLISQTSQRYCVINCSFTIKQPQVNEDHAALNMSKLLFENLKKTIGSEGLIICAAGNDYTAKKIKEFKEESDEEDRVKLIKNFREKFGKKEMAKLPATIEGIYGIGSLEYLDKRIAIPALYSMIADIDPGDGYWILGGSLDEKRNYLISLFASNPSGWAKGSGTSFAAAVASGTFATMLSKYDVENSKSIEEIKRFLNETVHEQYSKEFTKYVKDDNIIPVVQGEKGLLMDMPANILK